MSVTSRSVYDPSNASGNHEVGSYMLAGTDGDPIDSTSGSMHVLDDNSAAILAEIESVTYNEDSGHTTADPGIFTLAVRNDGGTSLVDTDLDYAPFGLDSSGNLYVNIAAGSLSTSDAALANVAIDNLATAVSTSAIPIVGSVLSGRKYLFLANEGTKSLYYGEAGVTVATGFPLHKGMQAELRIGPTPVVEVIGDSGSSSEDLRTMQIS